MFGPRLTRDYGDSVPDAWKQSIGQLKDFEVTRGIRRIAFGGSGSPPTLPQFLKACRTIGEDEGPSNPGKNTLPDASYDYFHMHAQKCLLHYLLTTPEQISEDQLERFIVEKNRIVENFRSIAKEDEVTGAQMRDSLFGAFNRVKNIREAA